MNTGQDTEHGLRNASACRIERSTTERKREIVARDNRYFTALFDTRDLRIQECSPRDLAYNVMAIINKSPLAAITRCNNKFKYAFLLIK